MNARIKISETAARKWELELMQLIYSTKEIHGGWGGRMEGEIPPSLLGSSRGEETRIKLQSTKPTTKPEKEGNQRSQNSAQEQTMKRTKKLTGSRRRNMAPLKPQSGASIGGERSGRGAYLGTRPIRSYEGWSEGAWEGRGRGMGDG
jgi:hypothetical protein